MEVRIFCQKCGKGFYTCMTSQGLNKEIFSGRIDAEIEEKRRIHFQRSYGINLLQLNMYINGRCPHCRVGIIKYCVLE